MRRFGAPRWTDTDGAAKFQFTLTWHEGATSKRLVTFKSNLIETSKALQETIHAFGPKDAFVLCATIQRSSNFKTLSS